MTADPAPDPAASEYLRRPDARGYPKVVEVLRNWDPIGGVDDPRCPRDEYDACAAPVVRLLDAGATAEQVANWMDRVAAEHMGLGLIDRAHTLHCAPELADFLLIWRATPS
jgi:hypothetical protein